MNEVELSIKGLLFYILKHWKSIAVAMFIGAVSLSGLQIIRDKGNIQNNQATVEVGASLTESERAYVESVYNYIKELRLINDNRKQSLIMDLNPKDLIISEMIYIISVEDFGSMEGVEQTYLDYLNGLEFTGYISEKTGIDNSDISDLVSVTSENSRDLASNTAIKIVIVTGEESVSDEITHAVEKFMNEKSSELSKSGYVHKLTVIGSNTYHGSDLEIQCTQLQYLQEIQSTNKTILDTENSLKDSLKEYYESLKMDSKEGGAYDEPMDKTDIKNVRPSVKYIILGLLAGAIFMCGIHFLTYILSNRLDEDDDVEKLFGIYLVGTVTGKDFGKPLYKLQHIGKRVFDFEESIKYISAKIKAAAQKENVSIIGIMGCGIKKHNEKVADEIISDLKKHDIETVLIDEPIYDPAVFEKLSGVDRVVLLEKAGVTYRTEIWKEVEMIKKLGLKAEGLIITE